MAPAGRGRGGRARGARGRGGASTRGGRAPAATDAAQNSDATTAETTAEAGGSEPNAPEAPAATTVPQATSSQPQPSTTPSRTATPVARGSSSQGAGGVAKFLPKGVRRAQADRDMLAQQELKKQESKAAIDAKIKARANRARGRRARGSRGGSFPDRIIRGGAGMGAFSSERGLEYGGSRAKVFTGASSGGGGAGGGMGRGVKSERGHELHYGSSNRNSGPRVNADDLAPVVDLTDVKDEEEAGRRRAVMPVGMVRHEHKDPEVVVATSAELEAAEQALSADTSSSEDIIMQDGTEYKIIDDEKVWPGASQKRRIKVEDEDGHQIEITEIDELADRTSAVKPPTSPEQKKKASILENLETSQTRTRRAAPAPKDPEDQEAEDDLSYVLRLFGIKDPDGVDMSDVPAEERVPPVSQAGNMYLFQLPPVLPPLTVKADPKSSNPIKSEPNDDVVMLDAPVKGSGPTVDLTSEDPITVKIEDGIEPETASKGKIPSDAELYGKGGFVGKLNVRKSGKIELVWGGKTLAVSPGNPVSFQTSAIITETDDTKSHTGEKAGHSYGMGDIKGKFVVAPIWDEEEEWIVDPSELPPNGVDAAT